MVFDNRPGPPRDNSAPKTTKQQEVYTIRVAEIVEVTEQTNVFVWATDAYTGPRVWGE